MADKTTHEQSPQAVSAVPVGIPSAADLRGIADGGAWMVATVLDISETGVVNHAMHARWLNQSDQPPPLGVDDAGWGDLWAAGYLALERYRAQAIEARRAETGTGSVHESAVGETDAPDSQRTGASK